MHKYNVTPILIRVFVEIRYAKHCKGQRVMNVPNVIKNLKAWYKWRHGMQFRFIPPFRERSFRKCNLLQLRIIWPSWGPCFPVSATLKIAILVIFISDHWNADISIIGNRVNWKLLTQTNRSIFTRVQFWLSGIVIACVCVCPCIRVCVYQSLASPHDNSLAVYARITKFGWETQNTLVAMPLIFGGDRFWPSRSNLTWKSNCTSFWACPHDNLSLV